MIFLYLNINYQTICVLEINDMLKDNKMNPMEDILWYSAIVKDRSPPLNPRGRVTKRETTSSRRALRPVLFLSSPCEMIVVLEKTQSKANYKVLEQKYHDFCLSWTLYPFTEPGIHVEQTKCGYVKYIWWASSAYTSHWPELQTLTWPAVTYISLAGYRARCERLFLVFYVCQIMNVW